MAKASKKVVEVVSVSLELTLEEAETLATVLAHVGGLSVTSRRKHADSAAAALKGAGIKANASDITASSHVQFLDSI
jgi:hypothetical protein